MLNGKNKKLAAEKSGWQQFAAADKNRGSKTVVGIPLASGVASLLLLGALTVGSLLIFVAVFIIGMPIFTVKEVVVRNCEKTLPQEIITVANITEGGSIFAINRREIAQRVRGNPWISEVFVGREIPSRVVIEIKERKPIAIVNSDGEAALLDEIGKTFKPPSFGADLGVPVLTGDYKALDDDPVLYSQTRNLIKFLSLNEKCLKWRDVAEIRIDAVAGFSVVGEDGLYLHLGFGDYEGKFRRLEKVIAYIGNNKHLYVNLSSNDKVFVRKRGEGAARNGKPVRETNADVVI